MPAFGGNCVQSITAVVLWTWGWSRTQNIGKRAPLSSGALFSSTGDTTRDTTLFGPTSCWLLVVRFLYLQLRIEFTHKGDGDEPDIVFDRNAEEVL
jgi:hypothetical protein